MRKHMEFVHADSRYSTKYVIDNKGGSAGFELYRKRKSESQTNRVATVIYWDASGDFFLETFGGSLPLGVLERVIAEAKETIER
jgi:hypothetical protein